MINQELKYHRVSDSTIEIVNKHLSARYKKRKMYTNELFSKDVKLIGKKGEIYYFPAVSI